MGHQNARPKRSCRGAEDARKEEEEEEEEEEDEEEEIQDSGTFSSSSSSSPSNSTTSSGKKNSKHTPVIKEFGKSIGVDTKQVQGLIRLAKKNGEKLGFLA